MENRSTLNRNLAQMLKGGVIMDVTTPEQAKIAQDAGACAVMALERIPADIQFCHAAVSKGLQKMHIMIIGKVYAFDGTALTYKYLKLRIVRYIQ